MDETVTCLVRGPASRYPSGYLWLYPAWFVILSAAAIILGERVSGRLPLWLGVSEIGGLLLAYCTAVSVVLTARRRAFRADSRGILLGPRLVRKHPGLRQVYLPWPDVAEVRLVPRSYGTLTEIVLSPAAPPVARPSLGRRAAVLLGALVIPPLAGRSRLALTMPRTRPPAYRVRLCETTAGEVRLALHQVKPEAVPVRVVNSMAALLLIRARSRQPGLLLPGWPARQLRPPTAASRQ